MDWKEYYKPSNIVSDKMKENKKHREKINKKIHSFVIPIPGTVNKPSTALEPIDEKPSISESAYNGADTGIIGQQTTYFGLERTTLNSAMHPVTISSTVTHGFEDINNFLYSSSVLDNGIITSDIISSHKYTNDLRDIIPGTVQIDMNRSIQVQNNDGSYQYINPKENNI